MPLVLAKVPVMAVDKTSSRLGMPLSKEKKSMNRISLQKWNNYVTSSSRRPMGVISNSRMNWMSCRTDLGNITSRKDLTSSNSRPNWTPLDREEQKEPT